MMTAPTRPVMRYHGGKWRLAPWIIRHFPPHRVYVEPFGGAASVLMRKPRAYAEVYNDLDGEVVNVFAVLRDPDMAAQLERSLRLTPYSRSEFDAAYQPSDEPLEQARRTIIKSFMGFGTPGMFVKKPKGMRTRASVWRASTGFRSNSTRSGTTPAHDWKAYPDQIRAFVERLQGVVIENRDALELIRSHDRADTLHYVDPPYPLGTRDAGTDYRHEMTDDDHRQLAEVLHSVQGMVVLSGYPCELYDDELYPDWYRVERPHLADGARPRTEVLWMNPRAAE